MRDTNSITLPQEADFEVQPRMQHYPTLPHPTSPLQALAMYGMAAPVPTVPKKPALERFSDWLNTRSGKYPRLGSPTAKKWGSGLTVAGLIGAALGGAVLWGKGQVEADDDPTDPTIGLKSDTTGSGTYLPGGPQNVTSQDANITRDWDANLTRNTGNALGMDLLLNSLQRFAPSGGLNGSWYAALGGDSIRAILNGTQKTDYTLENVRLSIPPNASEAKWGIYGKDSSGADVTVLEVTVPHADAEAFWNFYRSGGNHAVQETRQRRIHPRARRHSQKPSHYEGPEEVREVASALGLKPRWVQKTGISFGSDWEEIDAIKDPHMLEDLKEADLEAAIDSYAPSRFESYKPMGHFTLAKDLGVKNPQLKLVPYIDNLSRSLDKPSLGTYRAGGATA